MDLKRVKAYCGDRLCLLDNIDCIDLLPNGTAQEVEAAVKNDITYFDTAPADANGKAERYLGLGLRGLTKEQQDSVTVSTKVGTHPQHLQVFDSDSVHYTIENSVKTLGREFLDIVFIHEPETDEKFQEAFSDDNALRVLADLKRSGAIGAIGFASGNLQHIKQALTHDEIDVIMPYNKYHLLCRKLGGLFDKIAAANVSVVNGSPYNAGLFAGPPPMEAAARRSDITFDEAIKASLVWRWCEERKISIGALAMQFSVKHPVIASSLVGPRNKEELLDCVAHSRTTFSDSVWDKIEVLMRKVCPTQ